MCIAYVCAELVQVMITMTSGAEVDPLFPAAVIDLATAFATLPVPAAVALAPFFAAGDIAVLSETIQTVGTIRVRTHFAQ
jgi:hypothetical protein